MGHEQDTYIAVTAAKDAYSSSEGKNLQPASETTEKLVKLGPFIEVPSTGGFLRNDSSGYFGYAIIREHAKQIYIAHRGSANVPNWFESNRNIVQQKVPSSWIDAYQFSFSLRNNELYKGYQFIETGHSLGGVFAILNTFYFKYLTNTQDNNSKSITFDNPGCLELIKDLMDYKNVTTYISNKKNTAIDSLKKVISGGGKELTDKILADMQQYFYCYLSAPNIVNTCNTQIGSLWRLYFRHTDPLEIQSNIKRLQSTIELIKTISDGVKSPLLTLAKSGATFLAKDIAEESVKYTVKLHDINLIADAFLRDSHMPILLRKIVRWPSLADLSTSGFWTTQVMSNTPKDNRKCELSIHQINNYEVSEFWIPRNHMTQQHVGHLIDENKEYSDIFNSWMYLFLFLLTQPEDFSEQIKKISFNQSDDDNLPTNSASSWSLSRAASAAVAMLSNGCGDNRTTKDDDTQHETADNSPEYKLNKLIMNAANLKRQNESHSTIASLKKERDELIATILLINNKKHNWAKIQKPLEIALTEVITSIYSGNNNNSSYHWACGEGVRVSSMIGFFQGKSSSSKILPMPAPSLTKK